MKMTGWYISSGVVLAINIFSTELHAQLGTKLPTPINVNPIVVDKVTVTATRNPVPAFEVPGMVTIIDRQEIETIQPSTTDDILKFVPGFEATGGPRRTGEVPTIRGFGGADVIVLFDGARQNFGSAHDGRYYIDPAMLRSVEVLRGSSSSLYGSGGTGGVIEFRTIGARDLLGPDESSGVRTAVGYQGVNEEKFASVTGYALPGFGLDAIANITYRDSGPIQLGGGGELDSDDEIASGLVKLGWDAAEDHYFEASYLGYFGEVQEPNNGQGAGSVDAVNKDISQQTFRLAYNYDNPDDRLLNIDAVAYYTGSSADEQRLDSMGLGPAGELLKREVATFGFRVDNRSTVRLGAASESRFTYGLEYYHDKQDGEAGGASRDGVPDAESSSFGTFLQAEISLKDLGELPGELLIVPGIRFDYYNITSDVSSDSTAHEVSPRLAVTYMPVPWAMSFVSYGKAFRAPTFDEMFLTGTHFQIPIGSSTINNFFMPNSDLKSQTTLTLEFGGGVQFSDVIDDDDRLQAKASYFVVQGKDFIALDVNQPLPFVDCNPFIPGNCDGTTTSTNVANAKSNGFELEAGYESGRFLATLGVSTIDAKDKNTGEPVGLLAPTQAMAGFAVKLPEIDSIIGWRGLFAAEFTNTTAPEENRSSYQTHDIYASFVPSDGVLKGLRLDVGVDNIFDAQYARTFTDANEPGRNFKATLAYKFNF